MSVILIVGGDEEFATEVRSGGAAAVVTIGAPEIDLDTFDLVGALTPTGLPDVLLLGRHVEFERAVFFATSVGAAYPTVPVVLQQDLDAEALIVALRSSVRDVIASDATVETVREVLHRVLAAPSRVAVAAPVEKRAVFGGRAKVITVISPKGGVGKTSVSTSLALGLAARAPQKVVLVDLDLQFGDIANLLDLKPVHTLGDVFSGGNSDSMILKTMLTLHPAGLHVLCGADSPATNEGVTGDQVRSLIKQLSTQFPYVIIDTSAGLMEPTIAALEASTDAVVISTMDVTCIRSVRKEIDVLAELKVLPQIRHMVVNMSDRQSGMKPDDIEAVVGIPVNVVIPQTPEVRLAANHGEPLVLKKRGGGAYVKAINLLIERIEATQRDRRNPNRGKVA